MKNANRFNAAALTTAKALLVGVGMASTVWADEYIAPIMVNIPAGHFEMGSHRGASRAKPVHSQALEAFQMGKYLVTVAEFKKFAIATGYNPPSDCYDQLDKSWFGNPKESGVARWDNHRYSNGDYMPVTCISWDTATEYATWLSKKTGQIYRLPSEIEWEYAAKAHTTSRYFWGDDADMTQACRYGNFADHSGEYFASKQYGASYVGFTGHANCDDGEPYNSIVGLYRPNPFGLFDMVGNVSQYLGTCYFDGYKVRTAQQMDIKACDFVSQRGSTWHYSPKPHAQRGRTKKTGWTPDALMGFRLASGGHFDVNKPVDASSKTFETALKKAQRQRLATRPKLPDAPKSIQLVESKRESKDESNDSKDSHFILSWQPSQDKAVTGYEIYQSNSPYAHLYGGFYQSHYDKIKTVNAAQNSSQVTLDEVGGSFKVVAISADKLTSLPSQAAVAVTPLVQSIPGRIGMQHPQVLENLHLKHLKAKGDKPELFYLSKTQSNLEQPLVSATFRVNVEKSGWYTVNYRGRSRQAGRFFRLWQNNTLLGEFDYQKGLDDKTSNRHKVFLTQGVQSIQLSVTREGFDRWSLVWLDFLKVE